MDKLKNIIISKSPKIDFDITTSVIIYSNEQPLKEVISKHIPIGDKYNNLIQEINQKFKKNPKQESIMIINNPISPKNFHKVIIIGYPTSDIKSVGVGLDEYRHIGFRIYKGMSHNQLKKVNIICSKPLKQIEYILEGLLLSTYKFNQFKTKDRLDKDSLNGELDVINVICQDKSKQFNKLIDNLVYKIESIFLCKNLVNLPPNHLKPDSYIKHILNIIKLTKLPIKTKVFTATELKKKGMNLILSVGQTSAGNNSRLMILKYEPKKNKQPDYVLLGKGITYDTGGIRLKGYKGLKEGKFDMAGSAVVLSALIGSVLQKSKKNIVVYCPMAENNIDSQSFKVGDVIKSYSGSTVEIDDTDAEGRLLMGDCLSHIVENYPKSPIIDVATLTQQQEDLSCRLFTTLQGTNNKKIAEKLVKNGELLNEQVLELPIKYQLKSKLESKIADIKNTSGTCNAQLMISSLFLNHFIKEDTNWSHLDIAGPSVLNNEDIPYILGESSGIGVKLLLELLK